LNLFELLATGVRTDVFDLLVVERAAGGRILGIASNYRPWIEQRRKLLHAPRLYQEIEWLAEQVEKHRKPIGERDQPAVSEVTTSGS
jgi:hypothetical protein